MPHEVGLVPPALVSSAARGANPIAEWSAREDRLREHFRGRVVATIPRAMWGEREERDQRSSVRSRVVIVEAALESGLEIASIAER